MNYNGSWTTDYYIHNFGVGTNLFARYYLLSSKTKLFIHGGRRLSCMRNRSENSSPTSSSEYYFANNQIITNYYAALSLVHFITSNVGLEFTADYRKESFEFSNSARKSYNFEVGLFAYFKGKKSKESILSPNTETKTWLVVGSIVFSSLQPSQTTRGAYFDFTPKVGFLVKDDLVIGLPVPVTLAYNEFSSLPLSTVATADLRRYGLSIFGRYYFLPNKTKLFFSGELGYVRTFYTYAVNVTFPISNITISKLNYALGGGLTRLLSANVALGATLGYRNLSDNIEQRGLFLQLGVFTYLRGRGR